MNKNSSLLNYLDSVEHQLELLNADTGRLLNHIKELYKENEDLKNGIYEKELIKQQKSKIQELTEHTLRGFYITDQELEKILRFKDQHENGKFEYSFIPTVDGEYGKVTDMRTGDKLIFREPCIK